MFQSVVLSFLVGVLAGNGIPHFVRGITKERYPCMLGNSPVPNFLAGWIPFVLAGVLAQYIDLQHFHAATLIVGVIGLLLIGLFHAGVGAFGRPD